MSQFLFFFSQKKKKRAACVTERQQQDLHKFSYLLRGDGKRLLNLKSECERSEVFSRRYLEAKKRPV